MRLVDAIGKVKKWRRSCSVLAGFGNLSLGGNVSRSC
jgi:hypothetical protein